jgi:type II restriction enzyme
LDYTLKVQNLNFDEISVVNVDGETQKPDCDLVIYSLNEKISLKKCIIISLKTSLREGAGQTYKWKLLMEIATSNDSLKEKHIFLTIQKKRR